MGDSTRLFSTIPVEAMERLNLFEALIGPPVRQVVADLVLAHLPSAAEFAEIIGRPDVLIGLRADLADKRLSSAADVAARIKQLMAVTP